MTLTLSPHPAARNLPTPCDNPCPSFSAAFAHPLLGWRWPQAAHTDPDPRLCAGRIGWAAGVRTRDEENALVQVDYLRATAKMPRLHTCEVSRCDFYWCKALNRVPSPDLRSTYPCRCWCYLSVSDTLDAVAQEARLLEVDQ